MTYGVAPYGLDPYAKPAMSPSQPVKNGTVTFTGVGDLSADGLRAAVGAVTFSGAADLAAAGLRAGQGSVTFSGQATFTALGGDLAGRLLTDDAGFPVWAVELQVFKAR